MSIKITTLVENKKGKNKALETVHGLSFLIEKNNKQFLFDTAQGDLLIKNAAQLGLDLNQLEKVIISHNHYDHGGGLKSLITNFGPQNIVIHNEFFKEKYSISNSEPTYRSIDYNRKSLLKTGSSLEEITADIKYIGEGIFIAANFEYSNDFEKVNKRFYLKENGEMHLDYFKDEIALGIESSEALIILLGCSHPGAVNIISSIIERTGKEIYAVLGGSHLVEAGEERISKTVDYFKELNLKYLGLSHCTGKKAEKIFAAEMPSQFFNNNTGSSLEI